MDLLALELFGGFQATLRGGLLPGFRTRKVAALLIYLATEEALRSGTATSPAPRRFERQKLMDLLWPNHARTSAQNNLRQTLFHLRHAFHDVPPRQGEAVVPVVVADRGAVWINPDAALESDVARFADLLRGPGQGECLASVPLDRAACRAMLEAAGALYQGDFLDGVDLVDAQPYQEWVLLQQEMLRRWALQVLEALAMLCLHTGDLGCAEAAARRQIDMDALREPAYRQLMEALARSGHRSRALRVYDALTQLLRSDLGVPPANDTRRLHSAVLAERVR
jgi:DNA-binding SARP family transcriptional activator